MNRRTSIFAAVALTSVAVLAVDLVASPGEAAQRIASGLLTIGAYLAAEKLRRWAFAE